LRKIIKILNSENIFEENNLDPNYYTSNKIYKIIKKNNLPYFMLSMESIVDLIIKHNLSEQKPINSIIGNIINSDIKKLSSDSEKSLMMVKSEYSFHGSDNYNLLNSISKLGQMNYLSDEIPNLFSVTNNNFLTLSSLKNLRYEHNDSALIKLLKNTTTIEKQKEEESFNFSPPKVINNIELIGESPRKFEFGDDCVSKNDSIRFFEDKEIVTNNTFKSLLNFNNTSNSFEKFKTIFEFQQLNG
jgi:hypothetical protein